MNPTDQARKESRKRELKKNKKQRQMVRSAVLKGKNPRDIIQELEKIDDMEYNVHAPPALNQKVLGEKRRKLAETWERVIKMYEKDLPEQWAELRKLWANYQSRKIEVVKYYESVKNAQAVTVDEIPLPNMSSAGLDDGGGEWEEESSIPLPPPPTILQAPPKSSILKKPSIFEASRPKLCPGVPAGPPPPLEEYEDVAQAEQEARKRTIRFGDEPAAPAADDGPPGAAAVQGPNNLQKKMLEMAGQDLDQFMKEMEEVHRQREAEKAADLQQRLARLDNTEPAPPGMEGEVAPPGVSLPPGLPAGPPGGAPPGPPPGVPPMLYRPTGHPPPLRPGVPPPGVRLPPGPPPGRMPTNRPAGPRPGLNPGPGMRPPPGPPSGAPPRGARPNMPKPLGVVSAKPQLNKPSEIKTGKVIEGAPVMRNLRGDVTRFVPTNLRVKRDDSQKTNPLKRKPETADQQQRIFSRPQQPQHQQQQQQQKPTKDDAYAQFMAEMSNLL